MGVFGALSLYAWEAPWEALRRARQWLFRTALFATLEAPRRQDQLREPLQATLEALRRQDQLRERIRRPCPGCTVMTERVEGCNMMSCPNCHREWCFLCGMSSGSGCSHFFCAHAV